MSTSLDHTIAALSTPPGQSAIAVVRMSGGEAFEILRDVFRPAPEQWEHRRVYYGRLGEPQDFIDDVMCAIQRAPESYTGEDVAEISCHGNTVIIERALRLLYGRGARPAEPGEFTKRAFLNGKMDLIQAEAVADLIHARSDLQRKVAHAQLAGRLSTRIEALAEDTLALLGVIEANIDFIEEDIDVIDTPQALATLDKQRAELEDLLESAELSRPFHEGYRVVLAGPANAGKSSLFNRLVGEQRAIVTDIPGTTRDVLREPLVIEGLVFLFQDTAGLNRGAGDHVENIGVGLAHEAVAAADVILFVVDGARDQDEKTLAQIESLDPTRAILVRNKIDLGAGHGLEFGAELRESRVSALTGEGVDGLKREIVSLVGRDRLALISRERIVLNARLASLLERAAENVAVLRQSIEEHKPLETMAVDARELLAQYEEATGRKYHADLLDVIFSRFCIGK